MRRESYSNRFATALEGVDLERTGSAMDRSGHPARYLASLEKFGGNIPSRFATLIPARQH